MNNNLRLAIIASLVAIIITGSMDTLGYGMYSAFVLIPLIPLFAKLGGISRAELGYVVGPLRQYPFAVIAPLLAVGLLTLLVTLLGVTEPTRDEWGMVAIVLVFNSVVGVLAVAITEEGFFRGTLYSLLHNAGQSKNQILWTTTLVFVVWHLSAVLIDEAYSPALFQVPIYLVNATLLGLIWGLQRELTGSIWPGAIYHSIWNAFVYQLYGFGTDSGDLAAEPTWIYGPEIGIAGIVLSGSVVLFLFKQRAATSSRNSL